MGKFESNDLQLLIVGAKIPPQARYNGYHLCALIFLFSCKQEVELFYSIQEVKAPFEKEDTFSSLAACKQCFYVCINTKYSVPKNNNNGIVD